MVDIVVTKLNRCRLRAHDTGDDAVVAQLIVQDQITTAHQVRDRREVRKVAAHQRQTGVGADKFRECFFQFGVNQTLATDEAGAERTDPDIVNGVVGCFSNRGVARDSEVIIICEAYQR